MEGGASESSGIGTVHPPGGQTVRSVSWDHSLLTPAGSAAALRAHPSIQLEDRIMRDAARRTLLLAALQWVIACTYGPPEDRSVAHVARIPDRAEVVALIHHERFRRPTGLRVGSMQRDSLTVRLSYPSEETVTLFRIRPNGELEPVHDRS
jgi:hypothetical protein